MSRFLFVMKSQKYYNERVKFYQGGYMRESNEEIINIDGWADARALAGNLDDNIKEVESATGTTILLRNSYMVIKGDRAHEAAHIMNALMKILNEGDEIDRHRRNYVIDAVISGEGLPDMEDAKDVICYTYKGKPLRAKTSGQSNYVKQIRKHDMTFGIGPAGTGKTYIACAMAVSAYKKKKIEKIILARPAVEAGESLGFLPGDLEEKVDPYLRPLYDALFEILGKEAVYKLKEKGMVEIVPLAYMRGRTLDNSFIILDEAQNTTQEQMKMFLTRMGFNSKVVVNGDITQIDLPKGKKSGLVEACDILQSVEGIAFNYMTELDVVRHELVKRIIKAYREYENEL